MNQYHTNDFLNYLVKDTSNNKMLLQYDLEKLKLEKNKAIKSSASIRRVR